MKLSKLFAIALAIASFVPVLPVQTAAAETTTPPVHRRLTIQERKALQQKRIAQGVNNGSLTARETANLERKEAAINREERAMRAADGGRLTAGDRRIINHQQNQLSRQIYRAKHNNRTR